jgi:hypothetical protein
VYLTEGICKYVESPGCCSSRIDIEAVDMQTQTVLDPLWALYDVEKVGIRGVSEEFAEVLDKSMTAQRGLSMDDWFESSGWMGYIARLDNIYASAPKP